MFKTSTKRNRYLVIAFLFLLVFGVTQTAQSQTIWYVKNDAAGVNNGTSWTNAFTTIQAAIDAANGSEIIVVAGGTYTSVTTEVVLINPSKNFSGVKMYGGYAGNEILSGANLQLDSRNLITNASIIDGQTTRRGISISGFSTGHSLSEETLLDGFTIQNGSSSQGAGLSIEANGSTTISPVIRNTRFLNNQASYGGSVFLGIFTTTTTQLIFDKVLFKNNTAGLFGGAIYSIGDGGDLNYTVINSIFDGNSAEKGGAIGYDDAQTGFPTFINSTFYSNTATTSGNGGVIHIAYHDSPPAPATFKPAVFRNLVAIGNGQFSSREASAELTGTIDISHSLVSNADATALNVPAGIAIIGSGMLYGATAVATFTNAAGGDFSLVTGSPAIDAGSNASLPVGITTDFAGNTRIQNTTIDMGALEFGTSTTYIWTAGNSSDVSGDGSNWNNGVPPSGADIQIPTAATPYPVFTANFQAGDLTIENNATFTMAPGTTLTFAAGKGATGAGKIILKSDATGDASIGNLTGAGAVGVAIVQERYVAGNNRAFRYFSHPFSTAMPLSILAETIDITGTGAGFTPTATNNPSAFRFDPTAADDDAANDGGWIPFTSTSETIGVGDAIRILIRGSKGQAGSLLDGAYTPDPVTFALEGTINRGNFDKALSAATRTSSQTGTDGLSDWNLVGNPYASPINIRLLNNGLADDDIVIWNPRAGDAGGTLVPGAGRGGAYVTLPLPAQPDEMLPLPEYILPAGSGFFIKALADGNTITFTESMKVAGNDPSGFSSVLRTEELASNYGPNTVQLRLTSDGQFFDRFIMRFRETTSAYNEPEDGAKFANPLVNFFPMSSDGVALAIDDRPYSEEEAEATIPLWILSPVNSYEITVVDFDLDEGRSLTLYDRFTEETITLKKGETYQFEVTEDPKSRDHRFDMVMGGQVITSLDNPTSLQNRLQVFLMPNPAQQQVAITFSRREEQQSTAVRIINMQGVTVDEYTISSTEAARVDYPVQQLRKGVYLVEVLQGQSREIKRLIVR